jgi:hypothetical protein
MEEGEERRKEDQREREREKESKRKTARPKERNKKRKKKKRKQKNGGEYLRGELTLFFQFVRLSYRVDESQIINDSINRPYAVPEVLVAEHHIEQTVKVTATPVTTVWVEPVSCAKGRQYSS